MSIEEVLHSRLDDGELVRLEPMLDWLPAPRVIYVTRLLYEELEASFNDPSRSPHLARLGLFRSDLDHFTTGELVTIGTQTSNAGFMKRLEPEYKGVWEIRSRDPKPGIRAFGCFVAQDAFVVLNYEYRDQLGGFMSREFRDEIVLCQTLWRNLFHAYAPLVGENINEVIKQDVVEIANLK